MPHRTGTDMSAGEELIMPRFTVPRTAHCEGGALPR